MYLWAFVLYAVQVVLVVRRMPPVTARGKPPEKPLAIRADADG
jgi:hypothetical protein